MREATLRASSAMAIAALLSFSTLACFPSYSCVSKGSLFVRLPCEYLWDSAMVMKVGQLDDGITREM